MRKKLILIFTLMVACLCVFAGCNQNYDEFTSDKPYNAVLYSKATEWVDEDYLEEHYSEDYSEIITSSKRLKEVCPGFDKKVNFREKIAVVYSYISLYIWDISLIDIKIEGDKATVICDVNHPTEDPDACQPYKRSFLLIVDKIDVNEVEFVDPTGGM